MMEKKLHGIILTFLHSYINYNNYYNNYNNNYLSIIKIFQEGIKLMSRLSLYSRK